MTRYRFRWGVAIWKERLILFCYVCFVENPGLSSTFSVITSKICTCSWTTANASVSMWMLWQTEDCWSPTDRETAPVQRQSGVERFKYWVWKTDFCLTWDGSDYLRSVSQAHEGELVKPPGTNISNLHGAPFPPVNDLLPGVSIWQRKLKSISRGIKKHFLTKIARLKSK